MNADQLVKLSSGVHLPNVSTKDKVKDNTDRPGNSVHDYNEDFHHPNGIRANIESIARACCLWNNLS